jgi:hypothetical protein
MLSVTCKPHLLNVIMLNVIMLSVIMMSVEAPSIRLSWKSLPGTNILAYYENLQITDKKVLQHWPLLSML